MKITTINLFQFCSPKYSYYTKKEKHTPEVWKKKTTWIKEKLKNLDSDIVAFQEVFSSEELKKLCIESGYKYFAIVDNAKLNKNIYETCVVALASKHKIKNISKLESSNSKESFTFSRIPIKVDICINETTLRVYCVHLKSNRLNEFEHKFTINNTFKEKYEKNKNTLENKTSALYQRFLELKYLNEDIKKSLNENKNIIVLGDFNDKLNSFSLDVIKSNDYLNDIMQNNEIKEKYYFELIDAFDLTNNKKRKYTSYYKSEGNIIDYILVSKSLNKISNYEVDDFHLKDNKNGSLLKSDHAIVSCSIDLK